MEENNVFTDEYKESLERELGVPDSVKPTDKMYMRMHFKSQANKTLGYYPSMSMDSQDDSLKIWKVVMINKIVPCVNGMVPDLDIPCCFGSHGTSIIFIGTIEDILDKLKLLVHYMQEKRDNKTIHQEPVMA